MPATLKSYIDRILNSREREDAEKANTKEIYKELAADGYEKAVVGRVVNHLRKDEDKARDQSEKFDLYLANYLGASHVHARVREDDEFSGSQHGAPFHASEAALLPQTGGVETLVANSEPLDSHPTDALLSGAATRKDAVPAAPIPTNITQLHKFNPATHFANSKGLPRLHGCLKPDACGGSHRALCHSCARASQGSAA